MRVATAIQHAEVRQKARAVLLVCSGLGVAEFIKLTLFLIALVG
jgi:hypothetical protein